MNGFNRIEFDFGTDSSFAVVKQLEEILSSGHWSNRPLDIKDELTMLLIKLIRFGDIAVYKRTYHSVAETPELRQRAEEINLFINKRHISSTIIDIADIFSGYLYDRCRTEYNSLFYPELKAYVRHGGLPPDKLLELLESDGCEVVFLFPNTFADDDKLYYAFSLTLPKDKFLEELDTINNRIMEKVYDAMLDAMEKSEYIIPDIPKKANNRKDG